MNNTLAVKEEKKNSESDENRHYEPPHAFECTREKITALTGKK
jgi:hypothetical protein